MEIVLVSRNPVDLERVSLKDILKTVSFCLHFLSSFVDLRGR